MRPASALGIVLLGCSPNWLTPTSEDTAGSRERAIERSQPAPSSASPPAAAAAKAQGPKPAGASSAAQPSAEPASESGASGPALNARLHALRFAAQQRVLGRDCPPGPEALPYASPGSDARNAPDQPLGRFVPIENEAALAHFHRALARLAAGEDKDGKVRIAVYGASHTQADVYPNYLRAYLQSRFGDGGQGFVLLGRVNHWYRTADTQVRHSGLTVHHARYKLDVQNEPLGLFGAALVGKRGGAYAEIVTAKDSPNTRFEVHYFEQPEGGDFSLQVDGATIARIRTASASSQAAYYAFEAPPGRRRIRAQLHGNGSVRLFGITAETPGPGVVVDTLGIGGSRMTSSVRWREDVWLDALLRRAPDLITFAYGTNEVMSEHSIPWYERRISEVLTRLRKAMPDVSCLFLSPFDMPKPDHARLLQVIAAQRRVAAAFGCGFWDGYAFMGGEGAMQRWLYAKPPLATSDGVHLSRHGYVYAGIAIADALMRAYDRNPAYGGELLAGSSP